jgi:hypothetical protein
MRTRFLILCGALIGLACPAFAQVDNDFSAGGGVRIGPSTTTCNSTIDGAIRYNSAAKCLDLCDGSAWRSLNCSVCPTSGLVGHWKLDDGTGSTSAADASGSGNTGALTNMDAGTDWVTGLIGGALAFDGTDDAVSIGNAASVQLTTGTLAGWIKTADAGSSYRGIVVKQHAYGMYLKDNVFMTYDFGTDTDPSTGVTLADNAWHHVAMTFTSAGTNGTVLYLDGVPRLTTTITVNNQTGTLNVGCSVSTCAEQWFSGLIDDVRLYDRALSQEEIDALYNGGAGCQ